ncbi:conjugal transfer protein TraF [Flexistipes sp.]|uniref:conjugal transfer protein TraF n=1 Tax=Flexistipes sp. TaxID=3088135 RepID=UPI002E1C69B3|nr:conjugal transfer protein TraF [Flexistipes sp.]
MRIPMILALILFVTTQVFANDPTSGWHWYEEPIKEKKHETKQEKKPEPKTTMKQIKPPESKKKKTQNASKKQYNTSVKNFKFPLTEEAKRIPVLANWLRNPTEENAVKWLAWQAKYFEHNGRISRSLRNAYLDHGDKVYRLEGMPEQPVGSAIASRKEDEVYKKVFNSVADEVGIFFFYKKGCEFCEAEIRPLNNFIKKYDFNVLGVVSSPKYVIKGLPFKTKVSPGVFFKYEITSVPTIAAFYSKENDMQVIAKGYTPTSQIELNLRAFLLKHNLITKEKFINLWRAEDTLVLNKVLNKRGVMPQQIKSPSNLNIQGLAGGLSYVQ